MVLMGDIVKYISLLAALLFIFNFAKVRWYNSLEGIFLMGFACVTALYSGLISWVRFFGTPKYYDSISLLVFSIAAILLIILNIAFYKSAKEYDKQHRRNEDDNASYRKSAE